MSATLAHLGVEALNTARRWALSRLTLRRVLDSKTAPASAVEKAKRDYQKNTDDLEKVMLQLEKRLVDSGANIPSSKSKGPQKQFPWKQFLGMIAEGAKALETAVGSKESVAGATSDGFVRAEVIDSKPVGKP